MTPTIRQRHHEQPKAITDLAWKAQVRLCERYRSLIRRGKKPVVVVTAVGRELVGFLWAMARMVAGQPVPVREKNGATPPASVRARGRTGRTEARLASKLESTSAPAARVYRLDPGKTYKKSGR